MIARGSTPTGIAYDGNYIWSCDWVENKIYKHSNNETLSIIKSYYFAAIPPTGMCYYDGHLFVAEGIMHINEYDLDFENYASYSIAGESITGITYDGNNFWSCDWMSNKIRKHSSNFMIIKEYDGPGSCVYDIAFDGEFLWSCCFDSGKVYKHNNDETLSIADSFTYGTKPSGITFSGGFIWVCGEDSKIRKYTY